MLDRMHKAGIKVILSTPTYSIPTWLNTKYPDIVVTHNGTIPPLEFSALPHVPLIHGAGALRPQAEPRHSESEFPALRREDHPPGGWPFQGSPRGNRIPDRQWGCKP